MALCFEDAYFYESLTPTQVGASLHPGHIWPSVGCRLFAALLGAVPPAAEKEHQRTQPRHADEAEPCQRFWPTGRELLVLTKLTSGLDPAARSEIFDILLDFIQDERHSVLPLSSHITTPTWNRSPIPLPTCTTGSKLFAKNKDDLMEEYGILRCSQQDLDRLPPQWIAATCRTAAGCEKPGTPTRVSVLRALPGVVCDAASIDDIMRLTSKEG